MDSISKYEAGMIQYNGKCFYVSENPLIWGEAEKQCQETFNGHLAMPVSYDWVLLVTEKVGYDYRFHIGPNVQNSPYNCSSVEECLPLWKFPNGTSINFWSSGEPNNWPQLIPETCLDIRTRAKTPYLNDGPCFEQRGFICELDSVPQHPQSMIQYNGKCFYVSENPLIWGEAEKQCQETFNGHLAMPVSYDWVLLVTEKVGYDYRFHIGPNVHSAGPPYPTGTTATIDCSNGTLEAECLGEPYGWFFSEKPYEICSRLCVTGIVAHGEGCYYVSEKNDTKYWVDSEKACQQNFNGHLAYPDSNDLLLAINEFLTPTEDTQLSIASHTTNIVYKCENRAQCAEFWKYPNESTVPLEMYTSDKPDPFSKCQTLFLHQNASPKLRSEGCLDVKRRYICQIDAQNADLARCSSPPNQLVCNSSLFSYNNDDGDPPYPVGTVAELSCSSGELVVAECLGEPLGWFFHNDSLEACGICGCKSAMPVGCTATFSKDPDGEGSYSYGTQMFMNCSCPESEGCYVSVIATCFGYPLDWFYEEFPVPACKNRFAYDGSCYTIPDKELGLEGASDYCKDAYNGYVALAVSSDAFIQKVESLSSAKGLNKTIPIGFATQLSQKVSAYLCGSTVQCNAGWLDKYEKRFSKIEIAPGNDPKKCLVLDREKRLYTNLDCSSPRYFLCRTEPDDRKFECGHVANISNHVLVTAGSQQPSAYPYQTTLQFNYTCACSNETGIKPAVCLGHPVEWLFPEGIHVCPKCPARNGLIASRAPQPQLDKVEQRRVNVPMACYDSEKARHVDRIRAISFREARDAGADFITRSWVAKRLNRSEQFVKMNWQRDPYHCDMMACYDSEKARHVDRIRAISFREARDAGADFITRSWVAKRLNRSEQFVKMNWQRDPYHCDMVHGPQLGSRTLSDQSKEIIKREVGKQKRSVRVLTKILENERGKVRSHMTVFREFRRMGMKPFHVIRKPLLSEDARENRLWFANLIRLRVARRLQPKHSSVSRAWTSSSAASGRVLRPTSTRPNISGRSSRTVSRITYEGV
ncbi:unnamed protein product, partial [Cyprideis torosa]